MESGMDMKSPMVVLVMCRRKGTTLKLSVEVPNPELTKKKKTVVVTRVISSFTRV